MRPIDAACVSIWPSEYHAKFNAHAICFKVYENRRRSHFLPQKYPHVYRKTQNIESHPLLTHSFDDHVNMWVWLVRVKLCVAPHNCTYVELSFM